jgi:hypothetical protein
MLNRLFSGIGRGNVAVAANENCKLVIISVSLSKIP